MPSIYRSARGEMVNFDTFKIKQEIANAPMNIEVARRKEFIDNKEEKPRRAATMVPDGPTPQALQAAAAGKGPSAADFEADVPEVVTKPKVDDGPVPNLPKR